MAEPYFSFGTLTLKPMFFHPQCFLTCMGQAQLRASDFSKWKVLYLVLRQFISFWVPMPPILSLAWREGATSTIRACQWCAGSGWMGELVCSVIAHWLGHEASANQAGLCLNPHWRGWSQYQYWKCQCGKQPLTERREIENKVSFKWNSSVWVEESMPDLL